MTNTIFFHQVNRDYWSASTSPNETPRPSSAGDEGGAVIVEASSLSSTVTGPEYDLSGKLCGKLRTPNLKKFSFKELKIATSNFEHRLGEGGFGQVFKGWIHENKLTRSKQPGEGIPVAVKTLSRRSSQGHNEWLAEVNYLGQLYHPNLISLIGHCLDKERHLLVYEFMPLGSLNNHLFNTTDGCLLSWNHRMKIALGVAKGLAFLHNPEINVIHRGVNSFNILLDEDYNAKLSDFGLAMDGPADNMSHLSTTVAGTFGYLAPEYAATGNLTNKTDVYSFGVVLFEILSGRKAMDRCESSRDCNVTEWAELRPNDEKFLSVLDPNIERQRLLGSPQKSCNLALLCIAAEAKFRPNMDQIVRTLEQLQRFERRGRQ